MACGCNNNTTPIIISGELCDLEFNREACNAAEVNSNFHISQMMLDKLCELIQNPASIDSMMLNGTALEIVYNDGAGNSTTIDADLSPLVSIVVENGDGTVTHTSGDGTAVTFTTGAVQTDIGAPNAATPVMPVIYIDELTGDIYHYDGTNWENRTTGSECSQCGSGVPNAATPLTPPIYTDTNTGTNYYHNGINWVSSASSIVDNGDGTVTHTSSDGTAVTFTTGSVQTGTGAPNASTPILPNVYIDDASGDVYYHDGTNWIDRTNVSSIVDNGDGTVTHTAGDGTIVTFNTAGVQTGTGAPNGATPIDPDTYIDSAAGDIYYYDGTNWVNQSIQTPSVVTDNGDGTFTHTSSDGTSVTISSVTTITDNNDGTITLTDSAGDDTIIDACKLVTDAGCFTDVVVNADNSITYTYPDGSSVDFVETLTSLTGVLDATNNLILTYEDEEGTNNQIAVSLAGLSIDNSVSSVTFDSATNTLTVTESDGTVHNVSLTDLIDVHTLEDNGDGTFQLEDGAGNVIGGTIDICGLLADSACDLFTYNGVGVQAGDDIVQPTMVDNNDGTFHIEDGAGAIIGDAIDLCKLVADSDCIPVNVFDEELTEFDPITNTPVPTPACDVAGSTISVSHPNGTSQWVCDGTAWVFQTFNLAARDEVVTVQTLAGQTPTTNPPVDPVSGDTFLNTTDSTSWIYDGTAWITTASCIEQSAATSYIWEPFCQEFDNQIGTFTFSVATGSLDAVAVVKCVKVYQNGILVPASGGVVAGLTNGAAISVNGGTIEVILDIPAGNPGAPDVVYIEGFVRKSLVQIAGC